MLIELRHYGGSGDYGERALSTRQSGRLLPCAYVAVTTVETCGGIACSLDGATTADRGVAEGGRGVGNDIVGKRDTTVSKSGTERSSILGEIGERGIGVCLVGLHRGGSQISGQGRKGET